MFILVDTEIIEIINKPITKDVYAIKKIMETSDKMASLFCCHTACFNIWCLYTQSI